MRSKLVLMITFILVLILTGCDGQPTQQRHNRQARAKKKEFGRVYQSADGTCYTRSHHDSEFWYWMYVMNSSSPITGSSPSNTSPSSLSGGSWVRTSSFPSGLTATPKVVEENEGKPSEVEEDATEAEVTQGETIEENTTEAEAESAESTSAESDASSGTSDSGNSDSTGSDSGNSTGGDSTGGDSSGGDSSGGGDGGSSD